MINPNVPPDEKMSLEQLHEYVDGYAVSRQFSAKAKAILDRKRSEKTWYEKPYITYPLGVLSGLLVAYLIYIFGWNK